MNILETINKYDKHNMLKLLTTFPKQFQEACNIGNSFDHKIDAQKIKNIVFVGMGGSAIGGDVIISCLSDELTIPAEVNRNYFLPVYVDQSTLVIVSSFSGDTEESLSCYQNARSKNAQIVCITSGGELLNKAEHDGVPAIFIPGGVPPRTALGYLSIPILVLLVKSGLASFKPEEFEETQNLLTVLAKKYAPDNKNNPAIKLAQQLYEKIPIIYSSADLLSVAAMRWKGQFSENAKMLAFVNVFPELNHNEIVGWEQLPELLKQFQIIYLRDNKDFSRNQKRMDITKNILDSVTNPIIEFKTEGVSRLARLFSLIYLGDMVSFYLAMLNNVDPTPIEKIQLLKDRLKENN